MKKILILFLFLFLFGTQIVFAKKKESVNIPETSGYLGTLPNITQRFQPSETKEAEPTFEYQDGFNHQDEIKPAPTNNPAFVNIIMKKDKTSHYINDLNEIITIIEKLQTIIEEKEDVQKFNAQSYFLKANVEYFRDKYQNKSEESYSSFKKVMQLSVHAQTISQLRLEREIYSPYVTALQSGNTFSKNSIDVQLDYLLADIKETLVVLKEAK